MSKLHERTLKANYESNLVTEGLTQEDFQKISNAIDQLRAIIPDGANMFKQALDAANKDLAAKVRGGLLQSLKNIVSDPVAKTTILVNGVRTGMWQLPSISRLYIDKQQDTSKNPVLSLIPQNKQSEAIATFAKLFTPDKTTMASDALFELVKGNKLPYVNDLNKAVQELLQKISPADLNGISQKAAATPVVPPQTANQAPGAGEQPGENAAGGAATSNAQPTQQAAQQQPAQQAQGTQGAKTAQGTLKSRVPVKIQPNDQQHIDDVADFLTNPKRQGSPQLGVDKNAITQVLQALAKSGMLVS